MEFYSIPIYSFGVKIIGHSLGAGVAALITYILNSVEGYTDKCKAKNVRGIVFGCPPCLPYEECVKARNYLVSIFCQVKAFLISCRFF